MAHCLPGALGGPVDSPSCPPAGDDLGQPLYGPGFLVFGLPVEELLFAAGLGGYRDPRTGAETGAMGLWSQLGVGARTNAPVCRFRPWVQLPRLDSPALYSWRRSYTTWSEWVNTSIRSSWTYQPEMPTIVGIGIAPLLQWILIPPVIVALLRRGRATARPDRKVTTP